MPGLGKKKKKIGVYLSNMWVTFTFSFIWLCVLTCLLLLLKAEALTICAGVFSSLWGCLTCSATLRIMAAGWHFTLPHLAQSCWPFTEFSSADVAQKMSSFWELWRRRLLCSHALGAWQPGSPGSGFDFWSSLPFTAVCRVSWLMLIQELDLRGQIGLFLLSIMMADSSIGSKVIQLKEEDRRRG